MSEYVNLYAAIWEQAVIDDMKRVVKHLSTIGIDRAHKTYCKLSGEDVPKDDERFKKINEDIKAYFNLMQRTRTKEFLYFNPPQTQIEGQETPITIESIKKACMREEALNHIIHHLTR